MVRGSGDSLFGISGDWSSTEVVTISLQRERNPQQTPEERMIKLVAVKDSTPITICPKAIDLLHPINAEDCKKLKGNTYFTM